MNTAPGEPRRTWRIVSLTHLDHPLEEQAARARRLGADAVELRVDLLADPAAVRNFLGRPRDYLVLVTLRSTLEGGAWDGDDSEGVSLLEELGLLRPGVVDVEWRLWKRSANLRQKIGLVCRRTDQLESEPDFSRPRNALLLSHHDTRAVPPADELVDLFDALCAEPAEYVKAVFTAADALDALRVLEQVRRCADRGGLIGLAMGPAGLPTRVLAPKVEAAGVFAALDPGRVAAPGQMDLATLRERYRLDVIGPATRVFGVIGWPVGHSRSPAIHNAAMAHDGIDAVYLPMPVRPTWDDFARFMDFVDQAGWLDAIGFSVTLPHKEHALRWLTARGGEVDDLARRCGAVNTLARRTGGWIGRNTDVEGIVAPLTTIGEDGRDRHALVLGAGGAARAAVVALQSLGFRVRLANRTALRAADLAAELGCEVADWEDRAAVAWDVLLNATSLGMTPDLDHTPLPADGFRPGRVVFETIYTPAETRLLREARGAGCRVIAGSEMFLHQAAGQYRLWHGFEPNSEVMQAAFESD